MPTPYDVIRMVKATGIRPQEFLEFLSPDQISGISKDDPTWIKCNGSRYIMALRRDHNRCYFLLDSGRSCRAYEVRPLLCRLFPFKLQENRKGDFNGFTLHRDVACPRNRQGAMRTDILHRLYLEDCRHQDAYRELVKVFNRHRHPSKEPKDFIEMFVEG